MRVYKQCRCLGESRNEDRTHTISCRLRPEQDAHIEPGDTMRCDCGTAWTTVKTPGYETRKARA